MQRIGIAAKDGYFKGKIYPVIMHINFNTKHNLKAKKFILLKKNLNFTALTIIQNDEAKQYHLN